MVFLRYHLSDGQEIQMVFLRYHLSDGQEIQMADFWYELRMENWSSFSNGMEIQMMGLF